MPACFFVIDRINLCDLVCRILFLKIFSSGIRGKEELKKYINGETLHNKTIWRENDGNSDSIGFCFFDDSVDPEERLKYLAGVVDMSAVAVFERTVEDPMRKSTGIYRDPENDTIGNWFAAFLSADPQEACHCNAYAGHIWH